MSFRGIRIVAVAGLLCAAVVWVLLAGGCGSKNPKGPNGTDPGYVSNRLLNKPVYSPIDSSIIYEDTGLDSTYFAAFIVHPESSWYYRPVVEPGLYRLRLNNDDPAELMAPWGCAPDITPDGSTMYYHPGSWGGPIMKVQLPDGEPELVKDGCFIRHCWYSPDTLVVTMCNLRTYFLDLRTDSLHQIFINGGFVDVSNDQRICTSNAWCGDSACIGIYDSTGIWYFGPLGRDIRHGRWSPDGQEIVFLNLGRTGITSIWITDLEARQSLLAEGGTPNESQIFEPDFAMDGKYVIYVRFTTPPEYTDDHIDWLVQDGQIWIMSAEDGSGKRQLTTWSRIRP